MTTPAPKRSSRLPALAYATAVVTLAAEVFLMLTYIFEVGTDGPYYYATVHRLLGAVSHVLIAVLVIRLSRLTEPIGPSRLLVGTTVVISLMGAVFLILGISGLLGFSLSSLVAVGVLIVQALWMLRANTWLYYQGIFPPILARFGQIIGAGLLIGIALVAVSVFLPRLTLPHLIVLVAGVFIGGGQWLAWPIWFVMLGWHLRRASDADEEPEPDVAADAEPPPVPRDEPSPGSSPRQPSAANAELVAPPPPVSVPVTVPEPVTVAEPEPEPEPEPESVPVPVPEPAPESDFDRVITPRPPTDAESEPGTVQRPESKAAVTPDDVVPSDPDTPDDVVEPEPPSVQEPEGAVPPRPAGVGKPDPRGVSRSSKPRSAQPAQPPRVPQPGPEASHEQQPSDVQPSDAQPSDVRPSDVQPEPQLPAEQQPSESSPAAQVPPTQPPAGAKPQRRKVPKSEQRTATKPEPQSTTDTPWYQHGRRR